MSEPFSNVYADRARADAYAQLGFPGTYFLAFRDLPELFRAHVDGRVALDFGCGTGRSTRFLRDLGFEVRGVDIAAAMLERARVLDPTGRYDLVGEGDLSGLPQTHFDLILSAFTFDNIPTSEGKQAQLRALRSLLKDTGRLFNLVSDPAIYVHEWASFSTRDFPDNRRARSGDPVRIVMLDVPDQRPVEDVVCSDADYRAMYAQAGFVVHRMHQPLGRAEDGIAWVSETTIAPWSIYVLGPAPASSRARLSDTLASSSEPVAEPALRSISGPLMTAVSRHTPAAPEPRLANPTATSAAGKRLSNRPPTAPQAAKRGSDSSSNRRRRPAIPSTAEKNMPPKKPGTASAGSGASNTLKKASQGRKGRSLLATPISTPQAAHPAAHVRPMPTAPRMRLSHRLMSASHDFVVQSTQLQRAEQPLTRFVGRRTLRHNAKPPVP